MKSSEVRKWTYKDIKLEDLNVKEVVHLMIFHVEGVNVLPLDIYYALILIFPNKRKQYGEGLDLKIRRKIKVKKEDRKRYYEGIQINSKL